MCLTLNLRTREPSQKYLRSPDYLERARDAIQEMHRHVGDLVIRDDRLAQGGIMVWHLVMPDMMEDTKQILQWIRDILGANPCVNIMG